MSRLPLALLVALALAAPAASQDAQPKRVLRVCADPNNLPFSNDKGEGFENRIVELLAKDLGAQVRYLWWAQRRGFVRNTLNAGDCDLIPGIATGMERVATTRPYYRSTYVFVTRADRGLDIASFDDPRLRTLTVGVQMVGDDFSNTPPAHALARRGVVENVRGYTLYGDYAEPSPPQRIVQAVARGEVDVAVVWGPLAGYFATREGPPLTIRPVPPGTDTNIWPMVFDISMATRQADAGLRREVEAALDRHRSEVDAILAEYGVPRVEGAAAPAAR
jgi:mxaJ protein